MMSTVDLKAYTARAVELEVALYTQKMIMIEHEKTIHDHRPVAPKEQVLEEPVRPDKNDYIANEPSFSLTSAFIAFILIIIGIIAVMNAPHSASPDALRCFIFFDCVAIVATFIIEHSLRNKQSQKRLNEAYTASYKKYWEQLGKYNAEYQASHAQYLKDMEAFDIEDSEYVAKANKILTKHNDTYALLENALLEHYNQNIIFPKYRNMVAITTINEYLMSGRCYELEGPDGAYNLYELELRQNIIIGQLSAIVDSLEQIKSNQFSLYQELAKANDTLLDIFSEVEGVNESARMAAYFSEVTATLEASPRIYLTHSI